MHRRFVNGLHIRDGFDIWNGFRLYDLRDLDNLNFGRRRLGDILIDRINRDDAHHAAALNFGLARPS